MNDNIVIKGAGQHNLKDVDITIPRNKLVVVTGVSGSGKSSLAFDTLYAEGQRRYVESLSAYARMFLDRMQKPKVRHIEGLSPAIAIEQRTGGTSPRSTVATVTEIYDYLRLLYANVGIAHCPECGRELAPQSAQKICVQISALPEGKKLMILAPLIVGGKGEHRDLFEKIRGDGFIRVRVDGKIYDLDSSLPVLEKNKRHSIDVLIDRLVTGNIDPVRLSDSVELALKHGSGILTLLTENRESGEFEETQYSEHLACIKCNLSYGKLLPRNFSFNSPYGACLSCNGLGVQMEMDPEKVVPDETLSIKGGAIPSWRRGPQHLIMYYNMLLRKIAEQLKIPDMLTTPWKDLSLSTRNFLLYGSGSEPLEFDYYILRRKHRWSKPFEGILASLKRRMEETEADSVRERLEALLSPKICPECHGARLNKVSLAVTVGGLNLAEFNALAVNKALTFVGGIGLSGEQEVIARDVLNEVCSRLGFLSNVGLNYLSLDRSSGSLSGGEAQRIRLATQLGSALAGVLYILDEPSIGLHQKDNDRLLATLKNLRDLGNTVVVVEHDLDTMRASDFLIDLGPGAGQHGGEIVAYGTPEEVAMCETSLTGQFLSGRRVIEIPKVRGKGNGKKIVIRGAKHHNLKDVTVEIPLGTFTCVTGVSGSGKSSLVNEILVRAMNRKLNIQDAPAGKCTGVEGLEFVDKAIVIDQTPIGRTPRSNPATYTDAFNVIRTLFSSLPESKVRGYKPGRFSFNVKGGRCEECKGDGIRKIEMQFLSDVYVECSACGGKRFNRDTLDIRYKTLSIADVLDLTISEALDVFGKVPTLLRKLKMLEEVGLGYVRLGQSATTLSGGEAQRIKLAGELSRVPRGHTVYVLDEPTTGLHSADIDQLLQVLFKLRDLGNTVVVIEHNLDVVKCADFLLDLGPDGGANGGNLIASGTPEEVAKIKKSYTGNYLRKLLSCGT